MEMSNDKTITETHFVYNGWVITETKGFWSFIAAFKYTIYPEGDEFEGRKFAASIEEAKELIDEKQN